MIGKYSTGALLHYTTGLREKREYRSCFGWCNDPSGASGSSHSLRDRHAFSFTYIMDLCYGSRWRAAWTIIWKKSYQTPCREHLQCAFAASVSVEKQAEPEHVVYTLLDNFGHHSCVTMMVINSVGISGPFTSMQQTDSFAFLQSKVQGRTIGRTHSTTRYEAPYSTGLFGNRKTWEGSWYS